MNSKDFRLIVETKVVNRLNEPQDTSGDGSFDLSDTTDLFAFLRVLNTISSSLKDESIIHKNWFDSVRETLGSFPEENGAHYNILKKRNDLT